MRPQTVANNRRAHLTTTITTACAGILDLIDVDRPERVHTRHPSRNERDATDRKDGPVGGGREYDAAFHRALTAMIIDAAENGGAIKFS
jgi:hypothetical protein